MMAWPQNRDQLWAEAFHRYNAGEKSYLSEPMEIVAAEEQHQRQEIDPWTDAVLKWIAAPIRSQASAPLRDFRSRVGRIYLAEILEHCLLLQPKDQHPKASQRVGRILRMAEYEKIRSPEFETRLDGTEYRPEYWIPPETEPSSGPEQSTIHEQ